MKGLGQRIKTLRKARKLTLVEVSHKTGIDQATLSRMENEIMTGTLDSHMRIADVFGMSLPDLYKDVVGKITESRDRAVERKLETFTHSSGAVAELLTQGILQKKMMPILLKLKPKGRTEAEEHSALSERFIYILKGTIDVVVNREKRTLREGENIYFNASATHYFKNNSAKESVLLSIMSPPSL